jgi:phosphoglycerate kinase
MSDIPTLKDAGDLRGKRVLLRLDLNVPIENGEVRDAYRIESSLPTIEALRSQGAKTIIIAHLGKGKPEDTLKPVATYMRDKVPVRFLPLRDPDIKQYVERMQDGDVILLDNLRHSKGEEENAETFAKYLASLAEVYVNDAFAVSHRAHASVFGVAKLLPGFMGPLMEKEVANLSKAFNPERPFLFILGGAKISTKIPLLKKFMDIADHIMVGGASANNLYKAKGYEVGKSAVDEDAMEGLDEYVKNPKLLLPEDVVVMEGSVQKKANAVTAEETIVDIGAASIEALRGIVMEAKLIVWNGPLGYYEKGFTDGSKKLIELILESKATTIVGGGDTVALLDSMGVTEKFSFVSTAGGAMLDFLANGTLPGIEALRR